MFVFVSKLPFVLSFFYAILKMLLSWNILEIVPYTQQDTQFVVPS